MKTWSEVSSSDAFTSLPPDQQEAARHQYFSQVVAPQVPADDLQTAWSQFNAQTAPSTVKTDSGVTAAGGAGFGAGPTIGTDGQSALPQIVATGVAPVTRTDKIIKGMRDPLDGAAQLFEHIMPDSFNEANRTVNNWIAAKTGIFEHLPTPLEALASGGKVGVDGLLQQQENQYQAGRAAAGESGFDGYRTLGNVVSPMNLAVASRLPAAASTASLGVKAAIGALNGGTLAALNPVYGDGSFVKQKAAQAGTGAALGGAIPVVAAGAGRIISPNASINPEVQMLENEGVNPTIGQTLGGWANSIEEKAQSIPFVGDAIQAARQRARQEFNTAALNRAANAVNESVDGSGTGAVGQVRGMLNDVYEQGKSLLGNFRIDQQGAAEIQNLEQMAQQLPAKELGQFQTAMNTFRNQLTPQGHLLPDGFKTLDSKLTKDAASFSGSTDAYQQQLGDAISQLRSIIQNNAMRANPQAAELIHAADTGWANLVRVENAAVAAKNTGGVFTPGQLMSAVRATDTSVRDSATARGAALMQDLATAGQNVLGNKIPDSGTAGRLLGLGEGVAIATNPIPTIAGIAGGMAAYTRPIQNLLTAAVSNRPTWAPTVQAAINDTAPNITPSAIQIALEKKMAARDPRLTPLSKRQASQYVELRGMASKNNGVAAISAAPTVDSAIQAAQSALDQSSAR